MRVSIENFPTAARGELADQQLRANLRNATTTIRAKRAATVSELPDWEQLREAGSAIKADVLAHLDEYLLQFESALERVGGQVHWARDADEANAIVADLILQLDHDWPSHILVPAIHCNRREIRDLFARTIAPGIKSDEPRDLAEAARLYLRARFLRAKVAISSANFAVAETGTLCVVESEGNGRMCTTLPEMLISVVGIEKLVPKFADLEVFLQLLPRSSSGERMNPYTSLWTGVRDGDGPRELHVVLLDNGRTRVLADEVGQVALHCIRCSACLNVRPVYSRTGGHAYGSVYPGPIGAILTPQLVGIERAPSLPFASTLCGACDEVCPVKIDIPTVLLHLRAQAVRARASAAERATMHAARWMFETPARLRLAQRIGRIAQRPFVRRGMISRLPGPLGAWTRTRDLKPVARTSFRERFKRERG